MRGYLLCKTCKEILSLGKLHVPDDDHLTFWRGNLTQEQLGARVLQFLAHHLNNYYSPPEHDVQVVNEHYVDDMDDLYDYHDPDDDNEQSN